MNQDIRTIEKELVSVNRKIEKLIDDALGKPQNLVGPKEEKYKYLLQKQKTLLDEMKLVVLEEQGVDLVHYKAMQARIEQETEFLQFRKRHYFFDRWIVWNYALFMLLTGEGKEEKQ